MGEGFKLPKGSLRLGHNRQIKPITTRFAGDGVDNDNYYSSGIKQISDENLGITEIGPGPGGMGANLSANIEPTMARYDKVEFTAGGGKPFSECCPERTEIPYMSTTCEGVKCEWRDGDPVITPGTSGVDESEALSSVTPGTEEFHALTPHELRRNRRGYGQVAGRASERNIEGANRRIRKAIRRGRPPSEDDLNILTFGASDPDMDLNQFSAGTSGFSNKPAYGGVTTPSTTMAFADMQKQAQAMVTATDPNSAEYKEQMARAMRVVAGTGGSNEDQPQYLRHLDDKTMRLINRKNPDFLKNVEDTYSIKVDPRAKKLNDPDKKAFLSKKKKYSSGEAGSGTKVGNWLRKTF